MDGDPGILVDDTIFQKLGGKLESESMRATAATLSSFAAFILPVFFAKKNNIDSPDRSSLADLQPFCEVNRIAPHNVPTWVIVVRLQCPWSRRPFGFQRVLWRWIQFPAQRKVWKPLLSNVGVLVFLIGAQGIKRLGAENSHNPAEHIRLLKINAADCAHNHPMQAEFATPLLSLVGASLSPVPYIP